jgi:hypothetical protein
MSLFGKILAIVNIFAVVGVVALLAMNYGKRRNWEYAAFRQDLVAVGLPVDNKETDARQQVIAEKVGPETQQDLFKQASPNTPVATQEAEVARVRQLLDSKISAAGGDKKKQMYELAGILKPMADTIEQRSRMVSYLTYLTDDKSFSVLKGRLQAAHKAATAQQAGQARPYEERFRDALAVTFSDPPGPFGEEFVAVMKAAPNTDFDKALEQTLDNQLTQLQGQYKQMFDNVSNSSDAVAQRKRAIARLLFNMVEVLSPPGGNVQLDLVNNPAYKRFFIVVGVKAALEAVNEQGNILQGLVFETGVERLRERYLFAGEHRKVVNLVLEKKAEVDEHKALLALKKKEAETHAEKVDQRKRDVQLYEQQLAATREETTQHLEQLRKVSDQLFAERVKLRENSEDNQKLEKQIRSLEEGR